MDVSNNILHNFSVPQSKKTFLDSSGGTSAVLQSSNYLRPDASSQAISDMGHIVARIDASVSGQPLKLGNPLNGSSVPSSLSLNSNVSLDSSLNLCSTLGMNSQGTVVPASRTQFLGSSAPLITSVSGAQLTGITAVTGQVHQTVSGVKGILPAPLLGKVSVGTTVPTSSQIYKGTQVGMLL